MSDDKHETVVYTQVDIKPENKQNVPGGVISPVVNVEQIETPEFNNHIIKDIIQVEFEKGINDALLWRKRWKKMGYFFVMLSKILFVVGSILAFFEPYYKLGYLAMASGCINLIALFLSHCGDDAFASSDNNTRMANDYLKVLQIEAFPEDGSVKSPAIKKSI